MKSLSRILTVFTIITALPVSAFADTASLDQRLSDLEPQVAILKRQIEVDKKYSTKAPDVPIVTASSTDGLVLIT